MDSGLRGKTAKSSTGRLGKNCYRMAAPAEAKKVDITQHVLVPKHILLSEEEAKQVLSKFNISPPQLPVILATDTIAKAIGAKAGMMIKIERTGPTGKAEYYRRVV